MTTEYYEDKLALLSDLFGSDRVAVTDGGLTVNERFLPVIDDVIVALDGDRLPPGVRNRLDRSANAPPSEVPFASDVQRSFGNEWTTYPEILGEHDDEFRAYFDLVDLGGLASARVADLGCGIGRWSHFVSPHCREIVLVDYSEAIFVARRNLAGASNAVFVLADVLDLPFRPGAFDLVLALGVLHHLPVDARDALRGLAAYGERHLVYLYYALDNRPAYFRWLLAIVTTARRQLSRIDSRRVRGVLTAVITAGVYLPLAKLGPAIRKTGFAHRVPLVETYSGKSFKRLRQDAYDRFFTSIEQRFTRAEIAELGDTFDAVLVSDALPYWHFLCERRRG